MGLALSGTGARAIVGGTAADASMVPQVVMVLARKGPIASFCSAVVVAQDAVLTAAHCVAPGAAALKVHYRNGTQPVLADVTTVARHPGYRADAIRTRERSVDLALVRLSSPLPERFRPATLGMIGAAKVGDPFRLAGFGLAAEGEASTSGVLRTADVAARAPLSGLLLWAHGAPGSGACTGDSGGPVFAGGGTDVVGIMAWSAGLHGAQCGDLTQAVWVGPQRPWIQSVLAEWGAH